MRKYTLNNHLSRELGETGSGMHDAAAASTGGAFSTMRFAMELECLGFADVLVDDAVLPAVRHVRVIDGRVYTWRYNVNLHCVTHSNDVPESYVLGRPQVVLSDGHSTAFSAAQRELARQGWAGLYRLEGEPDDF
jgi:hypothetical protein